MCGVIFVSKCDRGKTRLTLGNTMFCKADTLEVSHSLSIFEKGKKIIRYTPSVANKLMSEMPTWTRVHPKKTKSKQSPLFSEENRKKCKGIPIESTLYKKSRDAINFEKEEAEKNDHECL